MAELQESLMSLKTVERVGLMLLATCEHQIVASFTCCARNGEDRRRKKRKVDTLIDQSQHIDNDDCSSRDVPLVPNDEEAKDASREREHKDDTNKRDLILAEFVRHCDFPNAIQR
eukprot:755718-Hanusia_phi.AAC.2